MVPKIYNVLVIVTELDSIDQKHLKSIVYEGRTAVRNREPDEVEFLNSTVFLDREIDQDLIEELKDLAVELSGSDLTRRPTQFVFTIPSGNEDAKSVLIEAFELRGLTLKDMTSFEVFKNFVGITEKQVEDEAS